MNALALLLLGALGAAADDTPAPAVQEVDRPPLAAAEIKALRDANLFSPPNPSRKSGSRRGGSTSGGRTPSPSPPAKPGPAVLTGIFLDVASTSYQAIFEDRNPEGLRKFTDPKFVKAGAEVEGVKIQAVTADRVTIQAAGAPRELRVGDSLPEPEAPKAAVSSAPAGESAPEAAPAAPPLDESTKNEVLENLKKRSRKNRPESPE